ncbi:MAG: tetratricopeptide (TPR) repeat protein [Lentimonas sp.]|jgi:tetratricopeptide (TPR) repeat protein
MKNLKQNLCLVLIILFSLISYNKALAQEDKFQKKTKKFYEMAQKGDSKAMLTLGNIYYEVKEYDAAMKWYLAALKKKEPDSYNNIGVMFRDGLGVPKNRKIAYDLFLYTHMMGLGDEGTQYRANSNLRGEVSDLARDEIREALCYTWSYVLFHINSGGNIKSIPKEVKPLKNNNLRTRLKDANWWSDREKKNMNFLCPKPWN